MNRIFANFLLALAFIFCSVQANALSQIIRKSNYCVIGHIISLDSLTYSFKVDSNIISKIDYDTIHVFKNKSNTNLDVTPYIVGQRCILFLMVPTRYSSQKGFFQTVSNDDGLFVINNDFIEYNKIKVPTHEFIQTISNFSKTYDSFCTTFQNGFTTSNEIEQFKKASVLNAQLINETFTYCFSDSSVINSTFPVVSQVKMNVLYIGPYNPICVAVPTFKNSDLYVTISHGEILRDGSCFKAKVYKPGRTQICVYDKRTNKSLGCTEFRVKMIPDPVVSVLGLEGGRFTKEMLQASRFIDVRLKNFDFDVNFPITRYVVTIACNSDTVSYTGSGNRFTPEIIEAFTHVVVGNKVYIEQVIIESEVLGQRFLAPIKFTIE